MNYQANGSGRDSYIFKNSGGLIKVKKIFNQNIETGSFQGNKIKKYEGVSPKLKRVTYKQDGSGRDMYARKQMNKQYRDGEIIVANQNSKKFNYLKSLRKYEDLQEFRTMCSSNNQRCRSQSPLRSKRLTFLESKVYNLPIFKEMQFEDNSPQYKQKVEQFTEVKKNIQNHVESTNNYLDLQKNLNPIQTIKASKFPMLDRSKQSKFQKEIQINSLFINPIKQLHNLLNNRKIVL